jgi:hypothetical protein
VIASGELDDDHSNTMGRTCSAVLIFHSSCSPSGAADITKSAPPSDGRRAAVKTDDDAVATCVLKIAELNDDEGPDEWEATLTNGAVAPDSAAKAFVKAEVVPAVFRAIVAWRDGLVEEMTLSPP